MRRIRPQVKTLAESVKPVIYKELSIKCYEPDLALEVLTEVLRETIIECAPRFNLTQNTLLELVIDDLRVEETH